MSDRDVDVPPFSLPGQVSAQPHEQFVSIHSLLFMCASVQIDRSI